MTYTIVSARSITTPLHALISLAGTSGTGKTRSAMELAAGLADDGKPLLVDTEAGRGLYLREQFDFDYMDFSPVDGEGSLVGYTPERYIEALDAAEEHGNSVIVFDSFTHVWEGINGVLELQNKELDRLAGDDPYKRGQLGFTAWGEPKKRYRRLLHRIIQARAHVILCIRAKERPGQWRNGEMKYLSKSKIRREDLPWDVAADKDLVYEMTCSFMLTPERVGVPIPLKLNDEHMHCFPRGEMISRASGKALLEWSRAGGSGDKELLDHARAEARKGAKAMNAMWQKLSKADRGKLSGIMDELHQLVAEADVAPETDTPFGQEAADDDGKGLSPEDEERIRREIAERDRELEGVAETEPA